MNTLFPTITDADWRESLAVARARKNAVAAQIRVIEAATFPAVPAPAQQTPQCFHGEDSASKARAGALPEKQNTHAAAGNNFAEDRGNYGPPASAVSCSV